MHAPSDHPNEHERQASLDDLEILDTPADPYMDSLVRVARDIFKVERVLISLIDRDRQWFKARAGAEFSCTPRDISFCGHAILDEHRTFIVPDALEDDRFADNPLVTGAPFIRFYAGHPLIASAGLPIGTLCLLHSQPRVLNEQEEGRLRDLAQLVEGYIKLRSLSEHTRQLREAVSREQRKALLDPLTQLWNRAALEHFYPGEVSTAKLHNEHIGVLFIDLDHFKNINDTYGHATGDQVLVEAAHRIATSLRPHDLLFRFGGEEFVVVSRIGSVNQLGSIAERIRATIANKEIVTLRGHLSIKASIGGAEGGPEDTIESLLHKADNALYRAKNNGRNTVCLEHSEAWENS
ncbi:GGDEF domain-containing protein [Pseudomonas asuensis]|uniref:GGDEF domain-containing protein n=1 Tax=Pseudomonas asuensis TaxID=1825787 RepID=A0ABQ2GXH9_9PSED|nr:sensor domain-containing diguanylate cyclase [Pseudomonas asuensis]GGM18448.1 GGDEF domain-containing protein [Pseudomonas asuensis]